MVDASTPQAVWTDAAVSHLFEQKTGDPRWALLYLSAPAVIFLACFIRPVVSIGVVALIVAAWISIGVAERSVPHAQKALISSAAIALLMLWFAGFPNGPYSWDWIKHWAIANELASHEWPLQLSLDGSTRYLRFYVGGYLVPALVHKIFPYVGVPLALGCWFFIGYVLVFQSASIVASRRKMAWIAVALLLALGGADMFAAHVYRALRGLPVAPWLGLHYDSWPVNTANVTSLEFSSMITALLWVPHQSIATFIVAGLLIFQRSSRALNAAMLGFGLLAIWSPYGMIGLSPLMLMLAWDRRVDLTTWRALLCALAGAVFAVVVIAYLTTESPEAGACFQCLPARLTGLPDFLSFWFVELICFALILRQRLVQDISCLISLITLLVIPLLHGQTPDFVMRVSMGPLFVLSLRSVEVLLEWKGQRWGKALQVAAICISLPAAVSEVVYQRQGGTAYLAFPMGDPLSAKWLKTFALRNDYTAEEFFEICGWKYLGQYFSKQKPHLTIDTVSHWREFSSERGSPGHDRSIGRPTSGGPLRAF